MTIDLTDLVTDTRTALAWSAGNPSPGPGPAAVAPTSFDHYLVGELGESDFFLTDVTWGRA